MLGLRKRHDQHLRPPRDRCSTGRAAGERVGGRRLGAHLPAPLEQTGDSLPTKRTDGGVGRPIDLDPILRAGSREDRETEWVRTPESSLRAEADARRLKRARRLPYAPRQ